MKQMSQDMVRMKRLVDERSNIAVDDWMVARRPPLSRSGLDLLIPVIGIE